MAEIGQKSGKIILSQGKYAVEILKRFVMMECKSMTTPMTTNLKLFGDTTFGKIDVTVYRQMIGSLMYLTNTRLDICFAVNTLSQYMVDLRQVHLIAVKHILRYRRVHLIMASSMVQTANSDWLAIQIQIGWVVLLTRRAP